MLVLWSFSGSPFRGRLVLTTAAWKYRSCDPDRFFSVRREGSGCGAITKCVEGSSSVIFSCYGKMSREGAGRAFHTLCSVVISWRASGNLLSPAALSEQFLCLTGSEQLRGRRLQPASPNCLPPEAILHHLAAAGRAALFSPSAVI